MNTTQTIGNKAEGIAKDYLQDQGLVYVCSNYRCRLGEIDLIFREQATLVFVEVKFRKNQHFGKPCEMVDRRKQTKIIRTAKFYLQQHKLTESVMARFDIIGITPQLKSLDSDKQLDIEWVRNAFYATGF